MVKGDRVMSQTNFSKIGRSKGDKAFDTINFIISILILIVILYPLYLIVISSISDPNLVNSGQITFWPKGITLKGYELTFGNSNIWMGYRNTIMYTVLNVALSLFIIIPAGYALSRRDLPGRNIFMFLIVFTMFVSGGIIPKYLVVRGLGMINTIWAVFVPSAVSVFNLSVTRNFFATTIPEELLDSAKMDGESNTNFFFRIVIPLSFPIIVVMALFNAVSEWNSFFPALIYLSDYALYPLQLIIREILLASSVNALDEGMDPQELREMQQAAELVKYAVIMVASIPMLILYPFLQRYFVKGVMIGSIKG